MKDKMSVLWVSGGQLDRIPAIGSRLQIKPHILFEVEGYGDSEEAPDPDTRTGVLYTLILFGHVVIPVGSPIEVLEDLLGGKL